MKKANSILLLVFIFCNPMLLFSQIQKQLKWEELPQIPGDLKLKGAYSGVSNGVLLSLGGYSENGTTAKWSDQVYILEKGSDKWTLANEKMPRSMAHGVSFSINNQLIIAGGRDSLKNYQDVYSVIYNRGKIVFQSLPSLPQPLAHATGIAAGNKLFIAGGNTHPSGDPLKIFLSLDLGNAKEWKSLDPWPGPARINAVSASVNNDFYLFGGADNSGQLKDAYKFSELQWSVLSPMKTVINGAVSPAPTIGLDHILFPGTIGEDQQSKLTAYNVGADTWLDFGALPLKQQLSGSSAKWNDQWVINTNAGIFSLSKNLGFGWINWITLIVYLLFMLRIGFLFDKKGQTTDNFFTAGGKIPWWAAGLSIYGSQISAITFMAVPAIVFATDWSLAIGSVLILLTVPIVVKYYIPFFRRLNVTSAYEYLEHRFSSNVRLLGSLSFILFQMGRMGIVLYLPAVAIASVTGINIFLLITIMGVICIIYTVMGGIEAVVWTDVAQVIILLGGALLCFFVAVFNIDGGFKTVISQGLADNKFDLFKLGWKPDSLVLWVCIVGFFFLNLIPYTSDQTVVQRYLTVKDEKQAAKSLLVNFWITLPATVVFFGLGTVLYIFYKDNPSIISSEKVDEILPYFVVQQLPAGISGLVIAGIFAASQSTLSSSMNSISASYFSDIYKRFNPNSNNSDTLRIARTVTVMAGVFGTVSAMAIAALDVQFIFDLFQEVLGILGGSLAGVFILGIFTKRASTFGVVSGLIAGVVAVWIIRNETNISVYLYGAISVCTCVIVGYIISFLSPVKKDISGLSYASLKELNLKK